MSGIYTDMIQYVPYLSDVANHQLHTLLLNKNCPVTRSFLGNRFTCSNDKSFLVCL